MIKIPDDNTWKWIEEHRNCDTAQLRLKANKNNRNLINFAILQIECRQKATNKLAQTLQNPHFIFPSALSVEQCTSDRLAEFHSSLISVGSKVLDMTAGLGIDVIHLARKASSVTAIDLNPELTEALTINANILQLHNIIAINADSCEYLSNNDTHFDSIFIDPARRGDGGKRLYAIKDCHPNVISILDLIKSKCDKLIIKASPMIDVSQTIKELPGISDIYAIGTRQECKELVAVIDFKKETPLHPTLHCVTLLHDDETILSFTKEEENISTTTFNVPQVGDYIYEPYPAVMKMQPFKFLAQQFGLSKPHPNTHLFSSTTSISDFPGERYIVERIYDFSSKHIKEISKEYPQASVAVKNFILTADQLRRRLKIKESNTYRLIGITATDKKRYILITRREHC